MASMQGIFKTKTLLVLINLLLIWIIYKYQTFVTFSSAVKPGENAEPQDKILQPDTAAIENGLLDKVTPTQSTLPLPTKMNPRGISDIAWKKKGISDIAWKKNSNISTSIKVTESYQNHRGKQSLESPKRIVSSTAPFMVTENETFIWVNPPGAFLERVSQFNKAISDLRQAILHKRNFKPWQPIQLPLKVLWCNGDDFMKTLANYTHVKTLLLQWSPNNSVTPWSSLRDSSNVLVNEYYQWSAMEPLCKWIQTPGYTNARWDAVYNRTCNREMDTANVPTSVEPVYFWGKPINVRDYWPNNGLSYPKYFYSTYPPYVLYMHVIEDAVILQTGDIISGNLKLVPYGCSQDTVATPPPGYDTTAIYSEVFLVSQFWGGEFFHKMIEGIPRLAPYVQFLEDHPNVDIHVVETGGYTRETVRFLGLNPERLITKVARAKVLYIPQATPCGFGQIQELQILNKLYCDKIEAQFGKPNRTSVIFIKRSGSRQFLDNNGVEGAVIRAARDFDFRYELFSDTVPLPMLAAMQMFNRAILIVAPHGGGLSNMIYSKPGTYVIEGVCNEPHVNLCYQWAAHVLGHRYHAIPARDGCEGHIDIEPSLIELTVRNYLQQIKWTQSKKS